MSREHKESASIVERGREKIIYFAKREKSRKWSTQCTYFVCLGTVIIHSNGDSDKSVRTERKFFYFICQSWKGGGGKLNFYYFCKHKKFVVIFFERLVIKVKKRTRTNISRKNLYIERMSELCMRK